MEDLVPSKLDGHPCREFACPFWADGECTLDLLDLSGRPDAVAWLRNLRDDLATSSTGLSAGE